MKATLSLLTALLLAPLAALHAETTFYVATDGNDNHDGKSLKTPFKRIRKAADVMQPGDTCLIRGGEYREKIVPPRSGARSRRASPIATTAMRSR